MDTTQSFGISAGVPSSTAKGGNSFTWQWSISGTLANGRGAIPYKWNTGMMNNSLTSITSIQAMTAMYISDGSQIEKIQYQIATTGSSKNLELTLLTSAYAVYTNSGNFDQTTVALTTQNLKSFTTGTGNIFVGGTVDFPVSATQPADKDLVGVAIKNVSGGNTSNCYGWITFYFNTAI